MKQKTRAALVALALLSAAGALAADKTLYIKSNDAKLLKEAKANAATVATLKAKEPVKWLKMDSTKQFHNVEAPGAKTGWVLLANLAPVPPKDEFLAKDDGRPIDSQAFASSGAATKGLSEAGIKYDAEKHPGDSKAALSVITLEQLAKNAKGGAK